MSGITRLHLLIRTVFLDGQDRGTFWAAGIRFCNKMVSIFPGALYGMKKVSLWSK
jgi:hypothetical protein